MGTQVPFITGLVALIMGTFEGAGMRIVSSQLAFAKGSDELELNLGFFAPDGMDEATAGDVIQGCFHSIDEQRSGNGLGILEFGYKLQRSSTMRNVVFNLIIPEGVQAAAQAGSTSTSSTSDAGSTSETGEE